MARNDVNDGVRIVCGNIGIMFDCLAFADDVVLLADDLQTEVKQIEILQDRPKDLTRKIETAYGIIRRHEKFKYLGEIFTPNGNEKEALGYRARKMGMAFKPCHDTYKSIIFQAHQNASTLRRRWPQ